MSYACEVFDYVERTKSQGQDLAQVWARCGARVLPRIVSKKDEKALVTARLCMARLRAERRGQVWRGPGRVRSRRGTRLDRRQYARERMRRVRAAAKKLQILRISRKSGVK